MSTLTQLITQVRDEISEPTAGFWSDAEITRWLNRANYDLADAAGVESSASSTITTADGTETYSLPSDFSLVEIVELVDSTNSYQFTMLSPMAVEERIEDKGSPSGYYVRNGSLYVVPRPDGVYTLRLWYYRAGVTLVNDSDTPIIPARFHDLIALFAIGEAKRKADDSAYSTYRSDYIAGRAGMIEYLRKKGQGNRSRRIVDVDER